MKYREGHWAKMSSGTLVLTNDDVKSFDQTWDETESLHRRLLDKTSLMKTALGLYWF